MCRTFSVAFVKDFDCLTTPQKNESNFYLDIRVQITETEWRVPTFQKQIVEPEPTKKAIQARPTDCRIDIDVLYCRDQLYSRSGKCFQDLIAEDYLMILLRDRPCVEIIIVVSPKAINSSKKSLKSLDPTFPEVID